MIHLCWLLAFAPNLTLKHMVELKVAPAENPRLLKANDSFWYADYWAHKVYKVDQNGNPLLTIDGNDESVARFSKPSNLLLFENGKTLLIEASYGHMLLFDTTTGAHIRDVKRFFPLSALHKFDEHSFRVVYGGRPVSHEGQSKSINNFFHLNLAGAHLDEKLLLEKKYHENQTIGAPSSAIDQNDILYWSNGYLETMVLDLKTETYSDWRLKAPKHYRPPPEKPLPRAHFFDRKRALAYVASFTTLSRFEVLAGRYLVVAYKIHTPYPYSLDVYDLKNRKRIIANVPVQGQLKASRGQQLILVETDEFRDDDPKYDRALIYELEL